MITFSKKRVNLKTQKLDFVFHKFLILSQSKMHEYDLSIVDLSICMYGFEMRFIFRILFPFWIL